MYQNKRIQKSEQKSTKYSHPSEIKTVTFDGVEMQETIKQQESQYRKICEVLADNLEDSALEEIAEQFLGDEQECQEKSDLSENSDNFDQNMKSVEVQKPQNIQNNDIQNIIDTKSELIQIKAITETEIQTQLCPQGFETLLINQIVSARKNLERGVQKNGYALFHMEQKALKSPQFQILSNLMEILENFDPEKVPEYIQYSPNEKLFIAKWQNNRAQTFQKLKNVKSWNEVVLKGESEIVRELKNKNTHPEYTGRGSRYKGVSKNGCKNWQVLVMIEKFKIYVGTVTSEELASALYDIFQIQIRGIKAKPNFSYTKKEIIAILLLPQSVITKEQLRKIRVIEGISRNENIRLRMEMIQKTIK